MLSLIAVFVIGFLFVHFWPQIRSFLASKVFPWVRENWGEKFANPLITITEWLDGKIRGIRRGFKECIRFVKERILLMEMVSVREPGGEIRGTRTIKLKGENGDVVIIKEKVDQSSLPIDIQNAILKQMPDKDGNRHAQLDEKQLLVEMARERLKGDRNLAQTQEEVAEVDGAAQILEMSA